MTTLQNKAALFLTHPVRPFPVTLDISGTSKSFQAITCTGVTGITKPAATSRIKQHKKLKINNKNKLLVLTNTHVELHIAFA